jgi:hypothetical protein
MISPTRPLMTPSGLMAMNVCSVDMVGICGSLLGELKRFVNCNASVVVMKVKRSVVMTRKSLGMDFEKNVFECTCTISIVTTDKQARALNEHIISSTSQEIARGSYIHTGMDVRESQRDAFVR